jgi:putative Ca2+/H+ antiporter (TMEM165/GDT1 family)
LEALLSSVTVVTLSEMGDKTQLLALALASKYRRPWLIMLGILIATLLNHALAAASGALIAAYLTPRVLAWILAITFLAFAVWTLKPDTLDDESQDRGWGPLVTTIVLFFLAEMGDKTQLATVALGAKFAATAMVIAGTTLGMLIADGIAVVIGDKLGERLPLHLLRYVAAGLFALMGVVTLLGLLFPAVFPALAPGA